MRPRLDESAARRAFEARKRPWPFRWLRTTPDSLRLRRPLEMVWLPWYLVRLQAFMGGVESTLTVSVQAQSRAFAIFQMEEDLVEGEPPGASFPPRMSEAEATRIGHHELKATLMRRRNLAKKPVVGEPIDCELVWYPYWVNYYERWHRHLDIRLVDAANGEKPGGRIKNAVFDAFIHAARNRSA